MSRNYLALLIVIGVILTAAPVETQAPQEFPTYPIAQAPAYLRSAIARGEVVIVSLQNAFLGELTRELGRGGPADAIKVCHLDATAAAFRVAREEGIAAGRTSDRLRDPTNAPRPWAAVIVRDHAGHVGRLDSYVVDLGDRIGLMQPLTHRSMCAGCHGTSDKLDPNVRTELKERYPVDRAVGFKDGEVRGWLWVEIPKY